MLNQIEYNKFITMPCSIAEHRQAGILFTLRSCQLFNGISPADLQNIADLVIVKSLEKGDYLFRQGDLSHGFYIVQSGAINVHRVSANGKEQIIHIFRPGESFAEGTLGTEAGYPADARAVTSSQVFMVQKSGFLDLLKRQPELALRMLGSMSLHVRILIGHLEDLTLKDVETRLANWLLKRCSDRTATEPVKVDLGISKRVLAAELGTVSETFSRTLAKLREQKLLSVNGKSITVLHPSRLAELLQRNLGD